MAKNKHSTNLAESFTSGKMGAGLITVMKKKELSNIPAEITINIALTKLSNLTFSIQMPIKAIGIEAKAKMKENTASWLLITNPVVMNIETIAAMNRNNVLNIFVTIISFDIFIPIISNLYLDLQSH
jgi:hypothetical protein